MERVKGQQQILVVAAAVAGASLSFGAERLSTHPEVMALLCLLYVGFALAMLRYDQEITIIANHLLDESAFGLHAQAQSRWERHKFKQMQRSGIAAWVASASQTVGIYGVPVLAAVGFAWAAIATSPTALTWLILSVAFMFAALFIVGSVDVALRYQRLGSGGS
jgi:hypothetical protein